MNTATQLEQHKRCVAVFFTALHCRMSFYASIEISDKLCQFIYKYFKSQNSLKNQTARISFNFSFILVPPLLINQSINLHLGNKVRVSLAESSHYYHMKQNYAALI